MFYDMKPTETTTAPPRVVDAHGLLHKRATKAAKACDAADLVDGLTGLQNYTLRLAAFANDVSVGSVSRARRLSPEQRQAVRKGRRPLVLPRAPAAPRTLPALPECLRSAPATPPVPPVTLNVREQLHHIVSMIGIDATLNLLAATGRNGNGAAVFGSA
jgi:hypothetical protein